METLLSLEDIADLREYERERDVFRRSIIEMKKLRRVSLGELVTVVFENRETMRFQVQEMVRAEKMLSDDAVQAELDVYNALIPGPGELVATFFIELLTKADLQHWLPRLLGVERSLSLRLADGTVISSIPEEGHEAQLTRDDVTASVHYVKLALNLEQQKLFEAHGGTLVLCHPNYDFQVELGSATVKSLVNDWR